MDWTGESLPEWAFEVSATRHHLSRRALDNHLFAPQVHNVYRHSIT